MKNILITIILGMVLLTVVSATENTNFTEGDFGSFNTTMISLIMSFSIMIPVIIVLAIFYFFQRGGSYNVNPFTVLIIGAVAVLITIFLAPPLIKSIINAIW